jgi:hypothetical protein
MTLDGRGREREGVGEIMLNATQDGDFDYSKSGEKLSRELSIGKVSEPIF